MFADVKAFSIIGHETETEVLIGTCAVFGKKSATHLRRFRNNDRI